MSSRSIFTRSRLPILSIAAGLALPLVVSSGCIGKRGSRDRMAAKQGKKTPAKADPAETKAAKPTPAGIDVAGMVGERSQVQFKADDPAKGAKAPLVTIVEYSDFECPFCGKLSTTLNTLVDEHKDDVRLVFRHYPLPKHANAEPAAKASLAAQQQGKFWEMHDKLFANQASLSTEKIRGIAEEIGLDMKRFDAAMNDTKLTVAVNNQFGDGRVLDVSTTPTFFVNGRLVKGAKPIEEVRSIVEEEIAVAKKLVAAGVDRGQLYAEIMKVATPGSGTRPKRDPTHRRGEASKRTNYAISVADHAPVRGPTDAVVTIVEYGNFECDKCKSIQASLTKVLEKYPNDVRLVWRHFTDGSTNAQGAARAAIAAGEQDKFWEMHDALMGHDGELSFKSVVEIGKKIGLDEAKFTASMRDTSLSDRVKADEAGAEKVRGTAPAPFLWVNGRIIDSRDDPTFAEIDALVAEEKGKAEAFLEENSVSKGELYEAMRKTWRGYKLIEQAEGR